jgi:pimeloyl-ACP methyl ester carboxylesterase
MLTLFDGGTKPTVSFTATTSYTLVLVHASLGQVSIQGKGSIAILLIPMAHLRFRFGFCFILGLTVQAAVVDEGPVGDKPFRRYVAQSGGHRITFYLSNAEPTGVAAPLAVWIPGTGCSSHFQRTGDGIASGLQSVLHSVSNGRARILAVEKPGVQFLDEQSNLGDASTCRPEFRSDFTLERWAETIATAIEVAQNLPGVDRTRTLVIGHSEGGIVAMRVSNVSASVTHAASLSGGGPVYLFHMAEFMRRRALDPEREVYACWDQIVKDPESATRYCWGQTYRQWSSFMKTSIVQEALASHASLYFAHGSADAQNAIEGFDVLRAELAANRRLAVFERIEGADHTLDLPNQLTPAGFQTVFRQVIEWFGANRTARH